MLAGVWVAYFCVLALALLFTRRHLRSQWLFWLRAFFPNWQFFHSVTDIPCLFARGWIIGSTEEPLEWFLIYPRRQRRIAHLLHNPDTNLALLQQTLVEHFRSDLDDLPDQHDPRTVVTYRAMAHIAAQQVKTQQPTATHYQFELRLREAFSEFEISDHYHVMISSNVESLPVTIE